MSHCGPLQRDWRSAAFLRRGGGKLARGAVPGGLVPRWQKAAPLHDSPGRSGGSIIVSVTGSVRLTPSGLFLTLKPCRKQKTTKLTNPITSRIPIKVSNDMAQSSPSSRPVSGLVAPPGHAKSCFVRLRTADPRCSRSEQSDERIQQERSGSSWALS